MGKWKGAMPMPEGSCARLRGDEEPSAGRRPARLSDEQPSAGRRKRRRCHGVCPQWHSPSGSMLQTIKSANEHSANEHSANER